MLYDAREKAAGAGEVSALPGEARKIHHGRATVRVERQGRLKGACCGEGRKEGKKERRKEGRIEGRIEGRRGAVNDISVHGVRCQLTQRLRGTVKKCHISLCTYESLHRM